MLAGTALYWPKQIEQVVQYQAENLALRVYFLVILCVLLAALQPQKVEIGRV